MFYSLENFSYLATIAASFTAIVSLILSFKSIRSVSRPILIAYVSIRKEGDRSYFLLHIKNYGRASAVIKSLECDREWSTITNSDQLSIIQNLPGLEIPPSRKVSCALNIFKIEGTLPLEEAPLVITTTLRYKHPTRLPIPFFYYKNIVKHNLSLVRQFKDTPSSLLSSDES